MTKTTRNTASAAEGSFHKHYASIWGEERWESLYRVLVYPTRYAALANLYAPSSAFWQILNEAGISEGPTEGGGVQDSGKGLQQLSFPDLGNDDEHAKEGLECYAHAPDDTRAAESRARNDFPQPSPAPGHPARLMTHWNLDAASALVAHLLDVRPGDSVLDLCAAPGGKSIALAQKMWPHCYADAPPASAARTGRLVSNEADGKRQNRLAENLKAYLPPELLKQGSLVATKVDATQSSASLNQLLVGNGYDKVLVDAPCSSERHIIHANARAKQSGNTAPEMATWRAGSSKRLAKTQVELLMTALKAGKVGGQVVYATCSIETTENDGVVEKMLALVEKERKKGGRWSVQLGFDGIGDGSGQMVERLEQWAERTKYGWIVLPDHPSDGRWGPLFFAMIRKVDGR